MHKDTFYFSHDYEPTSDPKIQALLAEYGGLGYGVFWRVIEMLHSDIDHKLPMKQYIYIAIAKQMLADAKQIESIIKYCADVCELFANDGEYFWSDRVLKNIELRQRISDGRREAGRLGGLAKASKCLAKRSKGKESKVKKSKEKTPRRDRSPKKYDPEAEGVYKYYIKTINPERKTKGRAITNIEYWMKNGETPETLNTTIDNYSPLISDRKYAKDPANFFGKEDQTFMGYREKHAPVKKKRQFPI